MKEDIIRQVKAAEDQAEAKIQKAKAQADKIVHDARHQAVESRMEVVEAARGKAEQMFEQGVKDFEPELENVRQRFENEITEDSAKAQQTFDQVVEFVVTKFQEQLGSEERK